MYVLPPCATTPLQEALQLIVGFLERGTPDTDVIGSTAGGTTGSTGSTPDGWEVVGGGGDAMLTAACVEALGFLRYTAPEQLAVVLSELDRQLALELMCPSSPTRCGWGGWWLVSVGGCCCV